MRRRLTLAEDVGLDWQETSITEDILLNIAQRFAPAIEIVPYTQRAEAKTGADWRWEWIFEGSTAWFAMLVQAKKLKFVSNAFGHGYEFGYETGDPKRPQVDVLLDYANANEFTPVYALYNGPQLHIGNAWPCPRLPPHRELLGVGLLAAETARYELTKSTNKTFVSQTAVTPRSVPFSCLAMCEAWYPCGGWPPSTWNPSDFGFPDDTDPDDIAFRAAVAARYLVMRTPDALPSANVSVTGVHTELPRGLANRLAAAQERGEVENPTESIGAVVFRNEV